MKSKAQSERMRNKRALAVFAIFLAFYVLSLLPNTRDSAREVFSVRGNVAGIGDLFGLTRTEDQKTRRDACVGVTNIIVAGTSDFKSVGQVTTLQEFLKKDKKIYPEGLVTGYAGPATIRAIKRYQIEKGLAHEGMKEFGVVDGKTQLALTRDMCADSVGITGVEGPSSFMTAEEAQKSAKSATPDRTLAVRETYTATSSSYGMGGNYYAGTDGRSGTIRPQILAVVGPRSIDIGKVAIWNIRAVAPDGGALTYAAYWGTASEASPTNSLGILTEGKSATFSTVFEKAGAHEIIFAAKNKAGVSAYESVVVSVGGAQFRGGTITFDVRDASVRCPSLLPTCDRFPSPLATKILRGSLVRYFGDVPQLVGSSFSNRDSFIGWGSLPAGQYEVSIGAPGYLSHIERFSINRGEQKLLKISLSKVGAVAPQLLRLFPEAGFFDDFINVIGSNIGTSDKVYLGGHYIGFLETRDGFYGFRIPRKDTAPSSCSTDFLLSSNCSTGYRFEFRAGKYSVQLKNDVGTSTKATLQIFEKTEARPFSPAVMTELLNQTPLKNQFTK